MKQKNKCQICGKETTKHKNMYGDYTCDKCFNSPSQFKIKIRSNIEKVNEKCLITKQQKK